MSTPEPLITVAWWRLILERVARQVLQTAAPILAVLAAANGLTVQTVLTALAGPVVISLIKSLFLEVRQVTVDPSAPWWVQILDRAVPAAVGVYVGFVPESLRGLLTVDWAAVSWAALSAAVLAVVAVYVAPPGLAMLAAQPAPKHAAVAA